MNLKRLQANAGNFLSRFAGVSLVLEALQTRVAHFYFCLPRINMPLLTCVASLLGEDLGQGRRLFSFLTTGNTRDSPEASGPQPEPDDVPTVPVSPFIQHRTLRALCYVKR